MANHRNSTGTISIVEQFIIDVEKGFSNEPKSLPSKYFYDDIGDELFVKIMHLPEYYLTRAEFSIFKNKHLELIQSLELIKTDYFQLIELGAGDGAKTIELLRALIGEGFLFDYYPVDISEHALNGLQDKLKGEFPELNVLPQPGDYFEKLGELKYSQHPKVVLFLGSNMGNMTDDIAASFIGELSQNLNVSDKVLLGVDLIKSAQRILPAYSDSAGITAEFNLNLLDRMNRELGANFNRKNFRHLASYDENEGIAKSHLQSTSKQEVYFSSLDESYSFEEGELIHTEISRKYNDEILKGILSSSSLSIIQKITDDQGDFADYILGKE